MQVYKTYSSSLETITVYWMYWNHWHSMNLKMLNCTKNGLLLFKMTQSTIALRQWWSITEKKRISTTVSQWMKMSCTLKDRPVSTLQKTMKFVKIIANGLKRQWQVWPRKKFCHLWGTKIYNIKYCQVVLGQF